MALDQCFLMLIVKIARGNVKQYLICGSSVVKEENLRCVGNGT